MKKFYNKNFIFIIISLFLIAIITIYFFNKNTDEVNIISDNFYVGNSSHEAQTVQIVIHITGEINSPGILYLEENSRIANAIDKAGGLTNNADLAKVNLAYELKDGQKIYIPSIYDEDISSYITETAGNNVLDDSSSNNSSTININNATQSELESLPGIGKSTANKIIDYRIKNGKFKTVEDIMNVSRYWRKQVQSNKRVYFNLKQIICTLFQSW